MSFKIVLQGTTKPISMMTTDTTNTTANTTNKKRKREEPPKKIRFVLIENGIDKKTYEATSLHVVGQKIVRDLKVDTEREFCVRNESLNELFRFVGCMKEKTKTIKKKQADGTVVESEKVVKESVVKVVKAKKEQESSEDDSE